MKLKKRISIFVFLLGILFSFSASAYNSWNLDCVNSSDGQPGEHVEFPLKKADTNNLVFEELENENDSEEDFLRGSFVLLPFSEAAFNWFESTPSHFSRFSLKLSNTPIFISIRVLRL